LVDTSYNDLVNKENIYAKYDSEFKSVKAERDAELTQRATDAAAKVEQDIADKVAEIAELNTVTKVEWQTKKDALAAELQ
jgi:hypothetical protein